MLSPAKAIVAGALVFTLGGLLLVAQPFDQQGSVPGAEQAAELAPPVAVTITESEGMDIEPEECTGNAPAICSRSKTAQWSASDPRLSGFVTERATEYYWPVGGYTEAYAVEVVNDAGAWVGTGRTVQADDFGVITMYTLTGEGSYEGLVALMTYPQEEDGEGMQGVIIDGGLPPFPEMPAE